MERNLSFTLHVLTARLDRAADRLLRAERNVSYSRFLALALVKELGNPTQRGLAEALGVTEPSMSRMTATLVADGFLDAQPDPAGGRRKRLSLTDEGHRLVTSVQRDFEDRFAELVAKSGVPYREYAEQTERLLVTLGQVWTEKGTR